LASLDDEFGEAITIKLGSPVRLAYFHALYRYLGRYEYTNILKARAALARLVGKYRPARVQVFRARHQSSAYSYFKTRLNVYEMILAELGVPVDSLLAPRAWAVWSRTVVDAAAAAARMAWWYLPRNPLLLLRRIRRRTRGACLAVEWRTQVGPGSDPEPGLLLLLDGQLAERQMAGLPVAPLADAFKLGGRSRVDPQLPNLPALDLVPDGLRLRSQAQWHAVQTGEVLEPRALLTAIVLGNFADNFNTYALPLRQVLRLASTRRILGGTWAYPPTWPTAMALLAAYLLQSGLPVVGRQHGGNYGIQRIYPRHFDSDFRWCTHFLSYGFTAADLQETYPEVQLPCTIVPSGDQYSPAPATARSRPLIDILFPISNASYFQQSSPRLPQHLLAQYQWDLLDFLDGLSAGRIVVKPFRFFRYATSAVVERLPRLKHVEVIDHLSFTECFEQYRVGAVLTEYPSSPLFEAIHQDTEILALTNSLIRYNTTADTLLRQRAHLFEDMESLKDAVNRFLAGTLAPKRSAEFASRYLLPGGRERAAAAMLQIFGGGG
jgi:hypothetical protein